MAYRRIGVRPVAGTIGAEVEGVDLGRPIEDRTFAELRRAFLEYLVLFFRDQSLTPRRQAAFSRRLGRLEHKPFVRPVDLKTMTGHPAVLKVVKEAADRSVNFGGTWHADVTFRARPYLGSTIYAVEVPDHGGDTMWANQYLAYESLPKGLKRQLKDVRAVHGTLGRSDPVLMAERYKVPFEALDLDAFRRVEAAAEQGETTHPVVRTHPETGRKSLFVNRSYTRHFEGMGEDASRPLLGYLYDHAVRPEFTVRWRWAPGMLALWDNRCTLHYALNDYHGQRRVLHRVSIHGDRPR